MRVPSCTGLPTSRHFFDLFKRIFITHSDKHAPYKDMNVTENKPHWLNNDLFELMNTRDALFKKAKVWTDAKIARTSNNFYLIKN